MTREEILQEFSDINFAYNNCSKYATLKRMIDELTESIIDKIRAEIENDWQLKKYPSSPFSCGLRRAIDIIDKYKAESEE